MSKNENNEQHQEKAKSEKGREKAKSHQIAELKKELKDVKNINEQLVKRIESLEIQKKILDEDYKLEVIKKAKLAQEELNKKVEEVKTKLNDDFKNAKKYAIEGQAIDLINIISQFENAVSIESQDSAIRNYLMGFKMFLSMFQNLLTDMNINEININVGDQFNEKTMEAVSVSHLSNYDKNVVTKIIKKGYKLHDKVIQFVQVEVNE